MKNILLLLLFIPMLSYGQKLPYKDGNIVYELTVDNNELSKSDLFNVTLDFLNNTLNKGSVFIQSEDLESGLIVAGGTTSFTEKKNSYVMFDLGFRIRSRFKMNFYVSNGSSTITVYDIFLSQASGNTIVYNKLTDDVADGMMYLSRLKDGKLKRKTEKEFAVKIDEINTTYYTLLALYKRAVENGSLK